MYVVKVTGTAPAYFTDWTSLRKLTERDVYGDW
jgi:hypothetical protein